MKKILTKGMIEDIAERLQSHWQALGFQADKIEYYEMSNIDNKNSNY